jgi:mono/diheme cytochrome c family protein
MKRLRQTLLHLLLSSLLIVIGGAGALILSLRMGWVSVQADAGTSDWESRLARWIRHLANEDQLEALSSPLPANRENIESGATYYREYCAQCHRGVSEPSSLDGVIFSPKPPDINELQSISGQELFWYAKKGIRVTGMPSFQEILSDEALWQIAVFLKEHGNNRAALEILRKQPKPENCQAEYTLDGKPASARDIERGEQ